MKTAKIRLSAFYSGVLSFLLALLGFSSCDNNNPINDGRAEYGTPSATFKLRGKVVSEETKTPIQNIQVTLQEVNTWKDGLGINYENKGASIATKTNTDGSFTFIYTGFPTSKKYIYLLEDIDGPTNGHFYSKLDSVLFTNPTYKNGSGSWNQGEAEKDFGTIELKPNKE